MEKEICCINCRAILDYVKEYGHGDSSGLLTGIDPEIDALPDPEGFLRDPNNWVSCGMVARLWERVGSMFSDDMVAYKVARYAVENTKFGYAQEIIVKTLWSYEKTIMHAQRINDKLNRSKRVEVVEIRRNGGLVRLHWHPHMEVSKDMCIYNRGAYTFMPLIWGGSPLTLNEECCFFEGAPYCEYRLSWPSRNRLHEVFSRFFTSKAVLMQTVKEMEEDKRVIQQKYEEVDRLNAELQKQMAELKRSRALLSRADKLSFLGNLSARLAHEIKNPMTAIGTFIQLLPRKYDDEEFRNNFYQVAMEETRRVNNLVTELLDLAKIRESLFELNDLHGLINKTLLLISPQSNAKRIEVVRRFDPDTEEVWMDEEKMKQVILNLLSNAVEFTPDGGRIEILTENIIEEGNGESVRITIRDNGTGIDPSMIDKIFDPYFTTKHKSSMHEGTGLGLFIAHQNMQDHKGTIEVNSEKGEGTTFVLTLPAERS